MGSIAGKWKQLSLLALGSAPLAPVSYAGAWTQTDGERLEITSVSRETGDFGETWLSELYIEQGVTSRWSVIGKVATQTRFADSGRKERTAGDVGLRRSFELGSRTSLAIQAGVVVGDTLLDENCSGTGYEARLALGRSWGKTGFVNVEAGMRSRGDACDRLLSEVSSGVNVSDDWRVLGKVMSDVGKYGHSTKAEATLFREFETFSLGLGYRGEISGKFEESGVVVALWSRF